MQYYSSESFGQRYGIDPTGLQVWLAQTDGRSGVSAAQWNDLSGNRYHAVQATEGSQPTVAARMRTFATSKYMTIPDQDFLSYNVSGVEKAYTWFAIVTPTTTAATKMIASKYNRTTGAVKTEFFWYCATRTPTFRLYSGASATTNYMQIASSVQLSSLTPSMVVVTYTGSSANTGLTIYVNGRDVSSGRTTVGTYSGLAATTQDVIIGGDLGTAGTLENAWNGSTFSYGMLYDRCLTYKEVVKMFSADAGFYGMSIGG